MKALSVNTSAFDVKKTLLCGNLWTERYLKPKQS